MSDAVVERVTRMVAPLVADLKLDLYDLEYRGGVLRITVDTPPGSTGGVDLDTIALLTRMIGRDFDHDDPMPGHYTLEVTSPGLERTLRVPAHWQREIGKTVNVRLRDVAAGDRRVQGTLIAATDTEATIRLDDAPAGAELAERVIPYAQVDRAKTVFVWGAAPKPGKGPSAKKSGAKPGAKQGAATAGATRPAATEPSTPTTSDPSERAGSRKEAQEAS
ncbi:MAG: ribosome maturation factor RimP [Acidimicrobiales bacterium]|nr:ribosome maturation factor RimP [Acidimicrobiales bacterium]